MDHTLSISFRLVILALTLLIWMVIYFSVNRLHVEQHRRIDLGLSIDRKIPFVPLFALVYFSTIPFVIQPFIILSDARQFYWMLTCFASITLISSLIHATIPSKIERVEQVTTGGITGRLLRQFQKTCKPYGSFPSMHVGLSVPAVIANYMEFGVLAGGITLVWAVLIALSTLYTKQHYILDVLAGLAGGISISALAFWLMLA